MSLVIPEGGFSDEVAQELEKANFTLPETFPSVGFAFTIRGNELPAPVEPGSEIYFFPYFSSEFISVDGVSNQSFSLVDLRESTLNVRSNSIFELNLVVGNDEKAASWEILIANEVD
jgi:hypothetical protein